VACNQHYGFAHVALPRLLDEDPESMIGRLSAADGSDTLLRLWNRVGVPMPPAERVEPQGLGVDSFRLHDGSFVAFVTLPTPAVSPEAWFVVIWVGPGGPIKGYGGPSFEHGYYTLELSEADDGSRMNVLAQWRQGAHANFGEGPPSNEGAFLRAVCALRGLPGDQTIDVLLRYLQKRTRSLATGIADGDKITVHGVPSIEVFDRLRRSPSERMPTESTFFQWELKADAHSQWRRGFRIVHRVSDETEINILEGAIRSVEGSLREELDRHADACPTRRNPGRRHGHGLSVVALTEQEVAQLDRECRDPDYDGDAQLGRLRVGTTLFSPSACVALGRFDLHHLSELRCALTGETPEAAAASGPPTRTVGLLMTVDERVFGVFHQLSADLVSRLRRLNDEDLPVAGERWAALLREANAPGDTLARAVLVRLVDVARKTTLEAPCVVLKE
jgi:hypothetical protein